MKIFKTFLFLSFTLNTYATNYYVSNSGNNANDGLSLASAFLTIQHAADQVVAGDTVFVADGAYAGFDHRNPSGTAASPIVFKTLGTNAEITSSGPIRNDGINIENADHIVIDGFRVIGMTGNGNGVRVVLANNCVVRNTFCDSNAERGIFTGFTDDILIEYNTCINSLDEHGIYVSNSSDRPIVRYNECYGNNNIGIHFNGDLSAGGDGIISDAEVYGNIIYNNNLAAGINMDGVENPVIYNNLIYDNHSAQGIALFQQDGAIPTRGAKVYNNTIIVPSDGRWGILVKDGSNVNTEIYNNIIINQHVWRGCIAIENQTSFTSDHNILNDKMSASGDGSTIPLADWQALGFDANSLLADALTSIFVDPNNGDFHLKENSQAIDAGTNTVSSIVQNDLAGNMRPIGANYDIGAYEKTISTPPVITDRTEDSCLVASTGAAFDIFGISSDISGDFAIVGAHRADNSPSFNQGAAYIFQRENGVWSQQEKLFDPNGAANEDYGYDVGIDGNYAIVGAYEHPAGNDEGKAYIYFFDGTNWASQQELTASDGAFEDWFGHGVDISGDYAIVGARFADVDGDIDQGKAYIFHRTGTTWTEQAILTTEDGAGQIGTADDNFGFSVAISGDYAVVGAFNDRISRQGKIYVYHRTGTTWTQQAALMATGNASDWFGIKVDINGDYVITGAPMHDTNGNSNQGKAYIFERTGSTWLSTPQELIASDGVAADAYGTSVAIEGNYAVVGANHHATNGNADQGKAYLYTLENGIWTEKSRFTSSNGADGDEFGYSVGISQTDVIVGARHFDVGASTRQGKAYIYGLTAGDDPLICDGENLMLTTDISDEQSFHASAGIQANNSITAMGNAVYTAGQSITLSPEFEVAFEGQFHAYIADCEEEAINNSFENRVKEISSPIEERIPNIWLDIYPNPLSQRAQIHFKAPKNETIQLSIFDFNGRLMQQIEEAPIEGKQERNIDASHFPAGIYWLRLQTTEGVLTRKFSVIKD